MRHWSLFSWAIIRIPVCLLQPFAAVEQWSLDGRVACEVVAPVRLEALGPIPYRNALAQPAAFDPALVDEVHALRDVSGEIGCRWCPSRFLADPGIHEGVEVTRRAACHGMTDFVGHRVYGT